MISDEERREAAERLRNKLLYMRERKPAYGDGGVERDGNAAFRNIADSVEPFSNMSRGCYVETVEHLADLIDRPTCENKGTSDFFICSRCGFQHPIAGKASADGCGKPVVVMVEFSYCPKCGRQVVRGE